MCTVVGCDILLQGVGLYIINSTRNSAYKNNQNVCMCYSFQVIKCSEIFLMLFKKNIY